MSAPAEPRRDVLVSVLPEDAPGYVRALAALGVPEERIRVLVPGEELDHRRLAATAAGVVLAGGRDIAPELWGEEEIPEAKLRREPERDAAEMELLDGARSAGTPVLGVCRGMQVANVYFGGTLWQDLCVQAPNGTVTHPVDHFVRDPRHHHAHPLVGVDATGPVGRLLSEGMGVNSRHHQAVRDLAPGLVALARAPDGVVEAFTLPDDRWWVNGVQWHPEDLMDDPAHRGLWQAFVDALRAHA